MNESDHEPSNLNIHPDSLAAAPAPNVDPKPLGKRRIWIVVVLCFLNPGLPFVYCGNFKLGIKVALFASIVFAILPIIALLFATPTCLILLAIWIILIDWVVLFFAIRYAIHRNKTNIQDYFNPWPRIVLFVIVILFADIILSIVIDTSVVQAYKVPTGAMEKTLLVGDYFLADKFSFGSRLPIPFVNLKLPARQEPKVDDIIIFRVPYDPDIVYLKRCIAIEGQSVEIIDKQLFIDDKLTPLPPGAMHSDINLYPHSDAVVDRTSAKRRYLEYIGNRDNMPRIVIPKGQLFVMGDNRDNSYDSRFWGCLDREAVLGKAVMIHWSWAPFDPCDSSTTFPRPPETSISRPWTYFRCLVFNACHFYERIRWSRIGMKLS